MTNWKQGDKAKHVRWETPITLDYVGEVFFIAHTECMIGEVKGNLEDLKPIKTPAEIEQELEKQRSELLELIYNSALSVVTMGHTVAMEELAQDAYIITGINAEQNASKLRNQAKGES